MSSRPRQSVERSPASDSHITYTEFLRRFPDNDACLEYLKQRFYPDGTPCPKCEKPSKFHRIRGRSAYGCQYCGHHVFPTAGTIFHKSSTSLQLWFWAIYLIASSKCGISAKQLGRNIGVTYKTAWRMMKQVRLLLDESDDQPPLSGDVEVDETKIMGKPRASQKSRKPEAWQRRQEAAKRAATKPTVLGMVERHGRVRAMVVPDRTKPTLTGAIRKFVLPESMIFTDEWPLYVGVGRHFRGHRRIKHKQEIYVQDDAGTQNVESFFALFKNSVRGAHHSISAKYLPHYLHEYEFRWNHRKDETALFWTILARARKDQLAVS